MLASLRQARAAFSHLNPQQVRRIAEREVRVGLIAASDAGYEAMEEALVPSAAPFDEREFGRNFLFRGGDPPRQRPSIWFSITKVFARPGRPTFFTVTILPRR